MNSKKLLYNVTVLVHASIHIEWLDWLRTEHVPAVLATGCFEQARIFRLLDVDETEGPTYTIQYTAQTADLYQLYIENYANGLRAEGITRWGQHFIAFRTTMQEV
jgi:hypothetical protein